MHHHGTQLTLSMLLMFKDLMTEPMVLANCGSSIMYENPALTGVNFARYFQVMSIDVTFPCYLAQVLKLL